MVSGWLAAGGGGGDFLEGTSERRESDWEPLLPEVGALEDGRGGPCEEEERLFCSGSSLFSSSLFSSSLSVGAFASFFSRCGEGEEEEEEEEPEEDEEEEEDLWGGGTSFGRMGSFTLSLSCSTSLCRTLS